MDNASKSLGNVRGLIVRGLRAHTSEIQQAIYTRIRDAVPHPTGIQDPDYEAGLVEAVTAVVEYSLDAIAHGPEWSEPIPSAAAAQARLAARVGVSLGTIQRRYFAGHREFGEFVTREVERNGLSNNGEVIHHLRRTQEALLEHLAAAIEQEYHQEQELVAGSRRSMLVQRLLSGEEVGPAELAELDYEIHTSWHLGLIASGAGVNDVIQTLKTRYGRKLLCVSLNGWVCVWLCAQDGLTTTIEHLSISRHDELSVSIGEPGRGLDGWRLTHDQAKAALAIAKRKPDRIAWYAEDRLLAATLENATLASSLEQKYLVPLGSQADGGVKLRRTLRIYIDLECNATSASHPLGVGRHTVENHVHTAEKLIGCPLRECLPELAVALRLEALNASGDGR